MNDEACVVFEAKDNNDLKVHSRKSLDANNLGYHWNKQSVRMATLNIVNLKVYLKGLSV